ncbi:glycosyltransferase family 4 protein [Intrasporangium calvum]|uniref:glycosyltransferase family 4 protein n=1 Tax=Intrasporangium calvum TaxID=53358 RepID=UPI000DF5DE3F|nr:glycosyltransferase family 1 protein [Intrasporangium calvum]
MSHLRLLYVIDSLVPGGAETSLVEMTPALVERGIELHILPLRPKLELAPSLASGGAVIHTRPATGRLGNVYAVADTIRRIRPDLVHTTLYEANLAGRVAARLRNVPVSTSVVGDSYGLTRREEANLPRLRLALAADQLTAHFVSRMHAVSESIAQTIISDLRVPRARIDVIPRGRRPEKYPFRPEGVRQRTRDSLGIPKGATVILTVGRLEPAKGLTDLLRALKYVTGKHPRLVVLVAGRDGRSSQELRDAASLIDADIRFLGHRSDVPALLSAADVLCFPSHREGSPGTIIEAMAVGCPVVASGIEPNEEILGRGERAVGRIFRTGDERQLADSLLRALGEPSLSLHLARLARARFEESFTTDAIAQRMNDFFHSAAAENPSGAPTRHQTP